ncbi:TonB-dependent receptor plug domain-containing protein [Filimonas effusa]|uniref:TonB-dependent receptor n=1 Tax=Filimonas effusa TaxID=2508721 RepID=A0A4Q1D270_9BACT|nr:TonB-dependent receptor [Filimonas effusa]RXK81975.1 TonB-dependent receptor [Filimonas effusa]
MKYLLLPAATILMTASCLYSQDHKHEADSVGTRQLEEVIVIGRTAYDSSRTMKMLASLDTYLDAAAGINMIKRGGYAWEPMLNGMATERSVITVDGMRIYGACTDRMDPITSYVDITHLAQAKVSHGQSGASQGSTIAGSIDLQRKKPGFSGAPFAGTVFSGLETSNMQRILGGSFSRSTNKFFGDISFIYRDADNYKAGGGKEINYTQFTKYNISSSIGYKLNERQHVEAAFIFDRASDVGYAALPMDVSLARAVIASVSYFVHPLNGVVSNWETKVYYNTVKHIMDDSKRPDVPVRMDMPGRAKTAGFYSRMNGRSGIHNFMANLSAHFNNSYAEMTMFSNDANTRDMFMLTWPDINTMYGSVFIEDKIRWLAGWYTTVSAGLGYQRNAVSSTLGLNSLKIFYPSLHDSKSRVLPSLSVALSRETTNWKHLVRAGYGQRAPSVSEAYGFYLFNSFDRFDYIGNPFLENEKSMEAGISSSYSSPRVSLKIFGNYFHILDYIIGRANAGYSAMTIGAAGVKTYESLSSADIISAGVDAGYQVITGLKLKSGISYKYGRDQSGGKLPLMQPFQYNLGAAYVKSSLSAEISVQGSASYSDYSKAYGETPAAAWHILNASLGKTFSFGRQQLQLKGGAENILDRSYTSFADWNRIPRMGRNFFFNIIYSL